MSHRRNTSRNGFTLLEVIIASSLVATLMLLVWSLFSVYSKLNEKGLRQATELQLVRSLIRQLRSDVHHAISGSDVSGGSLLFESTHENLIPLLPGARLVGSDTTLQLVVRVPRRDRTNGVGGQLAGDGGALPNVYDVVEYVWRPRSRLFPSNEGVPEREGLQQGLDEKEREEGAPGLTRRVIPWFVWNAVQAGETANETAQSLNVLPEARRASHVLPRRLRQLAKQEDFVPEVASLRFHYFDGSVWLNHWDSRSVGRLPIAIDVAFNLQGEEERIEEEQRGVGDRVSEGPVDLSFPVGSVGNAELLAEGPDATVGEFQSEYRFVIAVDTAKPSDKQKAVMMP